MSPHLPALSSHREREALDLTLDMEAAESCDTVTGECVLYVLFFLHVETDFQAC